MTDFVVSTSNESKGILIDSCRHFASEDAAWKMIRWHFQNEPTGSEVNLGLYEGDTCIEYHSWPVTCGREYYQS